MATGPKTRVRIPLASPTLALTTLQPGQELPFSQVRCRDCTPPPQLLLHLFQEPQDAQKMGTGQGLFSLQNLRGMKEGGHHSREKIPPFLNKRSLGMQSGKSTRSPRKSRSLFRGPRKSGASVSVAETPNHSLAHRSSRLLPTQMRPPWRGAGLLQLRCRTWNPIPQVVLHRAHDDHAVHAPFLAGSEGQTDDL